MAHGPEHLPHDHEEPDSWHRHTPDEGMPQVEHAPRVNIRALLGTFIVITIVVVALAGATIQLFRTTIVRARLAVEETLVLSEAQVQYREASLQEQNSYAWTADGEHVRIPIDQAMHKVVEQYSQEQGR